MKQKRQQQIYLNMHLRLMVHCIFFFKKHEHAAQLRMQKHQGFEVAYTCDVSSYQLT